MKSDLENHLKARSFRLGAMVEYHPISARGQSRIHQCGKKDLPAIFLGYALVAGGIWKMCVSGTHTRCSVFSLCAGFVRGLCGVCVVCGVCVGLWVCGSLGLWVCGSVVFVWSVGLWVCGSVGLWVCGLWVCGLWFVGCGPYWCLYFICCLSQRFSLCWRGPNSNFVLRVSPGCKMNSNPVRLHNHRGTPTQKQPVSAMATDGVAMDCFWTFTMYCLPLCVPGKLRLLRMLRMLCLLPVLFA